MPHRRPQPGHGMTPLFDVEAFIHRDGPPAKPLARGRAAGSASMPETVAATTPTPVEYWVRGIFRCGDGHFTRTVQAIGMSTRLDADVARFIAYLTTDGFGFVEGRGYLSELLGVGADDDGRISLGRHQ